MESKSEQRRNPQDFDLTVQHTSKGNSKQDLCGEEMNEDAAHLLLTNQEIQVMLPLPLPSEESIHSSNDNDSQLSYDSDDGVKSIGEEPEGCETKGDFNLLLPQSESESVASVDQRPVMEMPEMGTVEESVIRMLEAQYLLTPRREENSLLDEDTFSLMMISKVLSASWNLGMASFAFQIVLGIMIITNQLEKGGSIPFMVTSEVRVGQFFTILVSLASEHDVLSSIQALVLLGKDTSNWDTVVGHAGNRHWPQWMISIMIPNAFKLGQGLLVIFMSFIVIVQSDTIIALITKFTGLSVISRIDNILFSLAKYGFLGKHLQAETRRVNDASVLTDNISDSNNQRSIMRIIVSAIRPLVLTCLFLAMFGGLLSVALDQSDGKIFSSQYPKCEGNFQLAKIHFGDEICYGGPLNTLECDFEGGDCVQFNQAYPLCRDNGIINVEDRIGDGKCDEDLSTPECNFDGGDCCPYSITRHSSFGDGQCNGGPMSTKKCGHDNGDCREFVRSFPDCPLDSLALKIGADKSILGNGICDGGIYLMKECGYENFDCQEGQVGQDLIFPDANVFSPEDFSVVTSRDGQSMAIGLPKVPSSNETIAFYKYISNTTSWLKIGGDIQGAEHKDGFKFGVRLAINANGTIIAAIGTDDNYNNNHKSLVQIFGFDEESKAWVAVGEAYAQSGLHLDMNAAGDNIVVADPYNNIGGQKFQAGQIIFHSIDSSKQRKRATSQNNANVAELRGQSFQDRIGLESLTLAEISTEGTSLKRIMFTIRAGELMKIRVNQYDENGHEWNQLGDDIPSPNSYGSVMNSSGDRIAISLPSGDDDHHSRDYVKVYDYNLLTVEWEEVGKPIVSESTVSNDGESILSFGHSMAMNEDGTTLVISSTPTNTFGTGGFVEVFIYYSDEFDSKGFYKLPPKNHLRHRDGNVIQDRATARSNIFGLHLSLSDNGTMLSVGSYNAQMGDSFVKVFDLNKIFYAECAVPIPQKIGDDRCDAYHPYNSAQCTQDGGDCPPDDGDDDDDISDSDVSSAAPSISSKPSKLPSLSLSNSPATSISTSPSRQYLHSSRPSKRLTTKIPTNSYVPSPSTSVPTYDGDGYEPTNCFFDDDGYNSYQSFSVILILLTDDYPLDTEWNITHQREGGLFSLRDNGPKVGELYKANTLYQIEWTLTGREYLFTINDEAADGLLRGSTPGYFNIFVDGVRVVGNVSDGSNFGATDSVSIIHPCVKE
uniref:LNR domain-containing protein n=1 Tax=Chaetoceros debilis TaxID=122233 RepID=A0A7S3VDR2_9STRA